MSDERLKQLLRDAALGARVVARPPDEAWQRARARIEPRRRARSNWLALPSLVAACGALAVMVSGPGKQRESPAVSVGPLRSSRAPILRIRRSAVAAAATSPASTRPAAPRRARRTGQARKPARAVVPIYAWIVPYEDGYTHEIIEQAGRQRVITHAPPQWYAQALSDGSVGYERRAAEQSAAEADSTSTAGEEPTMRSSAAPAASGDSLPS